MRKHLLITVISALAVLTLFVTCKKPEDKVFAGSARVRGVVYFKNYLTGTTDTAKTAGIKLSQTGNAGNVYNLTLTNGSFDIQSLSGGDYQFDVTYDYRQPGSAKTDHYTITQPLKGLGTYDFRDNYAITLSISTTATPTLQVTVADNAGVGISGAQVCLYSDQSALLLNRGTCAGSVVSGTTNAEGVAIFSNLQTATYYASVNATIGSVVYNNQATDQQPVAVSSPNTLTPLNVKLSQAGYSFELIVKNSSGAYLANTSVCLYTDTSLLAKYRGKCSGSITTATSNSRGVVTFSGLQNLPYFVSAYQVVGPDTLSNSTIDIFKSFQLKPGIANLDSIVLIRNVPPPTSLRFVITDAGGANISGATVCLYSDPALLAKYRGTCTGSLFSGTSDVHGAVSFPGLQHINYYVSVYKTISPGDVLSNLTTDSTPVPTAVNQVKTVGVTIK